MSTVGQSDVRIRPEDLVESVSDALQYISYYHSPDYIRALALAHEREQSAPARDAIAQILANSRLCAEGHRPICQDTGIVTVFVRWGQQCMLEGSATLQQLVDKGVRKAFLSTANPLRPSIVADPAFSRRNTGDNTPAVLHVELVAGRQVELTLAAKGAGSENKARLGMLEPSDSVADWIVGTVADLGAGWCPPGTIGIGIGGTAEQAVKLAKSSLFSPVDMSDLKARGPADDAEALRIELYDRINALGIGAQGVGGLTTVVDVKIECWPTHAASLPVAVIPNCAATRHAHIVLDGSGPAFLAPPDLASWPDVRWTPAADARSVDLERLTRSEVASWRPGDRLLLTGRLLTGRDAAHRRLADLAARGEPFPLSFKDRMLYYVGPVPAAAGEAIGPAGPTTAGRMDRYTDLMLGEAKVAAMIGKAERGTAARQSIQRHGAAYLIAVGGAAYLVSRAIRSARIVAFADLGMEAIHEFEVKDMPVTVAIDGRGDSIHEAGPREWRGASARQAPAAG